jgi:hypothetical protein
MATMLSGSSPHRRSLLKSLAKFHQDGQFCDLALVSADNEWVMASRLVLSAASGTFRRILLEHFSSGAAEEEEVVCVLLPDYGVVPLSCSARM